MTAAAGAEVCAFPATRSTGATAATNMGRGGAFLIPGVLPDAAVQRIIDRIFFLLFWIGLVELVSLVHASDV